MSSKVFKKPENLERELENRAAEDWFYDLLTEECSSFCLDTAEERKVVADILAMRCRGLLNKAKF